MALRVTVNGNVRQGPRIVRPFWRGVAALLSVCVVAATLAAISIPAISASAMANPATAETATTTAASGPVTLSGTISYAFSYSATGPCAGCHTSESLSVTMAVSGQAVIGGHAGPDGNWDNPDVYRCVLAASSGNKCFWAPLTVDNASLRYHFATQAALPDGCHAQASATGSYKAVSTPSPLGLDIVFNPVHANGRGVQPGAAPLPAYGISAPPPAQSYRTSGDIALQMAMTYTNRAGASACGIKLPTNLWDLPIGFVGPYRPGQSTVMGSTTYEGLGTPRLSWDLALKATGLEITSPAASSTIAMTDGNYLSPQPEPNQSAPANRQLTVKGTDDSPGALTVRIGGASTRIASDGSWILRIPVNTAGPRKLMANDNVGASADEQLTLIDLVIASPAEGAVLPITAVPAMPNLGALAAVQGYPGAVSAIKFNWSLSARGEYRDRCGHNPDASCGQWYPYNNEVASGTTTGHAPWNGDFSSIEGGFGRLSVSADIPNVADEPVQSEPRWINIPGTNPSIARIEAYVSAQDPANASVEDQLFCHESYFTQFNSAPERREPATTTVPHDIGSNPGPFRPLYGAPYAGVGIAQKDPSSFPAQQWDWHANVDAGLAVYHEDLTAARGWRQAEQIRLSGELTAVLEIVNRQRTGRGMKAVKMAPRRIPPLTATQIQREAIRGYNGEDEYRFNLQYVVSTNHLSVKTVGPGKWVEGAGEWQDMAEWQAAGGPLVARQWFPAQDPGYVTLVKACHS